MAEISERALRVLQAIVTDYVSSREPVGSKSIAIKQGFNVSAATVRNDMTILEEEELITQQHTSSGRIPTDKGYRVFLNHLEELKPLTLSQQRAINNFLDGATDLDELLGRATRMLATLTNQVAIVQYPSLKNDLIQRLEIISVSSKRLLLIVIAASGRIEQLLIDTDQEVSSEDTQVLANLIREFATGEPIGAISQKELPKASNLELQEVLVKMREGLLGISQLQFDSRLVISGAANLVKTEQDFSSSVYPVLEAIEEQVTLLKLFAQLQEDSRGIGSLIGRENVDISLEETSIIATQYGNKLNSSKLGVLGPTRMDYPQSISVIRAIARYLSKTLGE
ncbi:MAG: heat-inducible transcription repressor HrcA [Microbacteriaceae bacterium]|nr:heat-inducible transcription repressor HrcA [Microbacteriaceae bacterium]